MAAPVQQRTWTIVANQRIPIASFATLVLIGGRYLKIIADALLANGYTCKGSCDGVTGAMDAVNRWITNADASVQAANTTTAVSWMVLTDGNGCDILLSFVGAGGNIVRISFSPGGLYAAAGTPTHTPTAADESVLWTGTDNLTTSLVNDRVVHVWIDSESKMMRTCCMANNICLSATWGVELINNNRTLIAFSPAVWGFAYDNNSLYLASSTLFSSFTANSKGGYARINGTTCNIFAGAEVFSNANFEIFCGSKPQLQRGIGPAMFPMTIGSNTATRVGPVGSLYDWYTGRNASPVPCGDVVGPGGTWMQFSSSASGPVWPWDGTTLPQIS